MKYLRLKKAKSITAVLRSGKKVHAETLTLVYLPANEVAMAVCVGKKYGGSVVRSKLKRLLREAFRACGEIKGCHVLLLPRPAGSYSFFAFRRDIEKILKRENLLCRTAQDDGYAS